MARPRPSFTLLVLGAALYAFLYAPLAVVVIYSFNASRLNAEWVGFTLHWYQVLLGDGEMLKAAGNSLLIALACSLLATLLGTLAAMALWRRRRPLLTGLVLGPVVVPEVLLGVSLLLTFVLLEISLGLVSITLAHTVFAIGFVTVAVQARLAGLDAALIEAARDLGASPWQAFRRVTLPLILPGVLAGALMAFTLSLDDFVVSFFTAGADAATLPLKLYAMLKTGVTPVVNAVSTLLMVLTIGLIILAHRLTPGILKRDTGEAP